MYIGTVLRPRQTFFRYIYITTTMKTKKNLDRPDIAIKKIKLYGSKVDADKMVSYCKVNFPIRSRSTLIVRVRTINCIIIHSRINKFCTSIHPSRNVL